MNIKRLYLGWCVVLFLTACGGGATNTPAPLVTQTSNPPIATQEIESAGFVANLSDAVEKVMSGPGRYQCVAVSGTPDASATNTVGYQEIALDLRTEDTLAFILPASIGSGEYALNSIANVSQAGLDFTVQVLLSPTEIYDQQIEGTITIEAISHTAGENAKGTFVFSASNGTNTINVEGAFDFTPDVSATYCPPVDTSGG